MASTPRILSQYFSTVIEKDLLLDGEVIPAGTSILFAPQTTAHSVRVPGEQSLLEAWPKLSKEGHSHIEYEKILSGYQTEMIKMLDRLTKIELWAASKGYK